MTTLDQYVSVRYVVDDVQAAIDYYTKHLGFEVVATWPRRRRRRPRKPAPAAVRATELRCSGIPGRRRHARPQPHPLEVMTWAPRSSGSWAAGLEFRSDKVSGPGGQQILLADPAGNLVELFQPAG